MIRDAEIINGNIPDTCLIRAGNYEVECMTKTVFGHGDVLSEVACTQTVQESAGLVATGVVHMCVKSPAGRRLG